MVHNDVSRNRFERTIMTILLAIGHMFGLDRTPSSPSTSDRPSSKTRQDKHGAEEARQRFQRAISMLALAVSHAQHGCPDAARTNLNAAWPDLRHNAAARIQYRATTALVLALEGKVRQAAVHLDQALSAYTAAHSTLTPVVRERIHQLCTNTMEYLPHSRHIEQTIREVYIAREQGDYVTALRLLEQADNTCTQHVRLVSPRTTSNRLSAWYHILEDMHRRGGHSTRTILDAFRPRQSAPATPFVGAVA